jgi:hypothetical protein
MNNNKFPELLMLNNQPVRTAELLENNAEDAEIVNAINSMQPGQTLQFGGGAAPIMTIVRPNEVHGNLFIFLYQNERGFILKAYRGRATKPMAFYRFRTEHERAGYLLRIKNEETSRVNRVEERKAERKAVTCELKVGDVLHYSWGYDQTNCEFYQVVALTAKGVKIREIDGRQVPSASDGMSSMSCQMEAVPNAFIAAAPVMTKRMTTNTSVGMSYGVASKWDGKPKYSSWYA